MEPLETDTEEWLGPKSDTSGESVAKISHSMNVQFTQKWCCCRSSKVSDIYHTTVDMPDSYGPATWQALAGWVGFEWHVPVTSLLFGQP